MEFSGMLVEYFIPGSATLLAQNTHVVSWTLSQGTSDSNDKPWELELHMSGH